MAGLAADLVMGVHLVYLAYVLLGGLLALRGPVWLWPHLVAATWGFLGLLVPLVCPLTELEKLLLRLDRREPYLGSFIDHYLTGRLYPTAWEEEAQAAAVAVILSGYVVAALWHARGRRPAPRRDRSRSL